MEVASPSIELFVAIITSSPSFVLSINVFIFKSFGPIPSKGDNNPPKT